MVDVGSKAVTSRRALARARVRMRRETRDAIESGKTAKGAVLTVARVAGIQAAKRTGDLIPLCHPLGLDHVDVAFLWLDMDEASSTEAVLEITTESRVEARTGVEMEALTAAAVTALTVYDMCKAIDRGMTIETVQLIEKEGGKSGKWTRGGEEDSPAPPTSVA
jgi:cyclic pyranopterin phosphate synthase